MPSWQVKNVDKSFNSTDASRLLFHFILGIGVGLTRDTSTLMVAQYFKRRREFVEIFVVAASGLGIALMSTFIFQATRWWSFVSIFTKFLYSERTTRYTQGHWTRPSKVLYLIRKIFILFFHHFCAECILNHGPHDAFKDFSIIQSYLI